MSHIRSLPAANLSLESPCELRRVADVCRQAREFLASQGLSDPELDSWELALAETLNNAVKHCLPEASLLPVRVDLQATADLVEIRVTDHTPGFCLPARAELPPEDCENGRGLFLVQSLTDEMHYLRGSGENCAVLRKRRTGNPRTGGQLTLGQLDRELQETRHTLDLMTDELASAYESLTAIFRFSAELQQGIHSEEFTERWLNQLLGTTESDWYVLRLAENQGRRLSTAAASVKGWAAPPLLVDTWALGSSVEVKAALERVDVWFEKGLPALLNDPLEALAELGVGFTHPLLVNDTLVGVLSVGRRDRTRTFQAGHLSVIRTVGDFLAIQIRTSQMQEEQIRARVNSRELEIAANIQRSLLPQQVPSTPGVETSVYYRSAREIGGDYYDAIRLEGGNLLFVMADVMGKGLPAALFSFMLHSLVRARCDLASRPGQFLSWLNTHLFRELEQAEMFITAQLVFLDLGRQEFRVATAGHPPFLVVNSAGEVTAISASGPPLGVLPSADFAEDLHPSACSRALMLTDGLIEAQNQAGSLLGLESVKEAFTAGARAGESSEALVHRLTCLLADFEQGAPAADDTAFLVISTT